MKSQPQKKNTLSICAFGVAGKGKSTFLNSCCGEKKIFKTGLKKTSVTKESSSYEIDIMNDYTLILTDLPGLCSKDMSLEEWKKNVKDTTFDAVFWVVSALDRVTFDDVTLFQAMIYLLEGLSHKNIILVVTHCDYIDEEELKEEGKTLKGLAEEFIETMKTYLSKQSNIKLDYKQIILYGKNQKRHQKEFDEVVKSLLKQRPPPFNIKENVDSDEFVKQFNANIPIEEAEKFKDEIAKLNEVMKELKKEHQNTVNSLQSNFTKVIDEQKKEHQITLNNLQNNFHQVIDETMKEHQTTVNNLQCNFHQLIEEQEKENQSKVNNLQKSSMKL